ncbi:MAG: (Rhomboid family) [Alphaproteobacteria bacterium]|nr:(Rhomboid family) [Alphaproteobacteria bacterium]
MPCIIPNFNRFFERLDYYGWPLLLLGIRFWMAYVFWRSGRIKLKHWDSTLSLFQFEYKICPLLLVAGFMARLATIPLLVITAVIQLTYVSHHDHLYWGFLLGVILLKGAGPLSLDALWCKWP